MKQPGNQEMEPDCVLLEDSLSQKQTSENQFLLVWFRTISRAITKRLQVNTLGSSQPANSWPVMRTDVKTSNIVLSKVQINF